MSILNTEARKERLLARLNKANEKLGNALIDATDKEINDLVSEIKQAEEAVKLEELQTKVNYINTREARKRALLKQIIFFGHIDADLLTNDMKLNKTKRKQAPELFEFADKQSVYFSIRFGITSINIYSEKGRTTDEFETGKKIFGEGDNPPVLNFESFEDACNKNGVLLKSITVKQVQKQLSNIKKATEALKAAEEKHSKTLEANNSYFLTCENFAKQQNANIHTLHCYF